jgi:hypothetical protein
VISAARYASEPEHSAWQLSLFPQSLVQPFVQVMLIEQLPSGAVQEQVSGMKTGAAESGKAEVRARVKTAMRTAALSFLMSKIAS